MTEPTGTPAAETGANAPPATDPAPDPTPEPNQDPGAQPPPEPEPEPAPEPPAEPEPDPEGGQEYTAENYQLEIPEGLPVSQKGLEGAQAAALEAGLTPEQFQTIAGAFMQGQAQELAQMQAANDTGWEHLETGWSNLEGGFDGQMEVAARGIHAVGEKMGLGGERLHEILKEQGAAEHPLLWSMMNAVGHLVSEDDFTPSMGGAPQEELSRGEIAYGRKS